MPRYVVGAQVPLPFTVRDATSTLVDAATQVVTVIQPDGTSSTPVVTHPGVGTYIAFFTPTMAGRHSWSATTTGPATVTPPDAFNVGTLTDAPLVGLADLREFLSVSATLTDAQLLTFGQEATDTCEQFTALAWRRRTVVEAYDGGQPAIMLRTLPVISVTSVVENAATLNTSTDYTLEQQTGRLWRGGPLFAATGSRWWLWGRQNITATYVVGPAAGVVPDDLLLGVKQLVRDLWDSQRGGSNLPRQQGADSDWVSRNGASVPPRVAQLWGRYTIPGVG